MQAEESIIAENICLARNLFQTEFAPRALAPQQTAELLTTKIATEYAYPTKHFEQVLKRELASSPS